MVEGDGERGQPPWLDPLILPNADRPRPPGDLADAQDAGLTRVEDGRTSVDAEDPDVGDGEGATVHIRRLILPSRAVATIELIAWAS